VTAAGSIATNVPSVLLTIIIIIIIPSTTSSAALNACIESLTTACHFTSVVNNSCTL